MPRVATLLASALLVLTATACRDDGDSPTKRPATTSSTAPIPRGQHLDVLVAVDGVERRAVVYLPESAEEPVPVVVVLHGGLGTPEGALTQGEWEATADAEGFGVLAPEGIDKTWNAGICCGAAKAANRDDVAFILATLDEAAKRVDIDETKIYATGISNGGMMTYRLGCETDRFAAIAPVAAVDTVVESCDPHPISLLHLHGLADHNVPFDGSTPTKGVQVRNPPDYTTGQASVNTFVQADACADTPDVRTEGAAQTSIWPGCVDGTAVELITIDDAGHSWPGGQQLNARLDPPSDALDATAVIWAFFDAHPKQ